MESTFCAVIQVGDRFFCPRKNTDVLGVAPDAIWFFGNATLPIDRGIAAAAEAAAVVNGIEISRHTAE